MSAAELARMLGVTPAAVSYALRGRPGVSEALRRRILAAADEHGVARPDLEAARGTRPVLGLVLADVGNPFYSELAISVTDAARDRGYEVFLSHTRDEPEAVAAVIEAMIGHDVSGVLLTAMQFGHAEVLRRLRPAGIPLVQISRRMGRVDADFVGIDDALAGAQITDHVLGHGVERVALVAGPVSSSASKGRRDGFRRSLERHGITLRREWNITGGLNQADGARAAKHLLGLDELPEAVICGTDAIALGLIDEFARAGVRVPEDLLVTGFDGLAGARTPFVDLTTMVQPRSAIAAEAVECVTERRSYPQGPRREVLCEHRLYIGKSCGCGIGKENAHVGG